jgi:hypothetical protein
MNVMRGDARTVAPLRLAGNEATDRLARAIIKSFGRAGVE